MGKDEVKGHSTWEQKDLSCIRNKRWNIRGSRTNVQYVAGMSMIIAAASVVFYVYQMFLVMSTVASVIAFQSLIIFVHAIQFISSGILLLCIGIPKVENCTCDYVRWSCRIWSGLSRFLIVFHTIFISIHFFIWTISPVKTAHAFYDSLISGLTVIFLAIGVHYVKLFIILLDANKDLVLKEIKTVIKD